MAKRGRPTEHTPERAAEILERIANGESLNAMCKDDHLPAKSTVLGWVVDDREGFADQYARARAIQAEGLTDELFDIADHGKDVNRDKLRVDARKWYISKVLPKFRDRLSVSLEDMTDEELAALAAGKSLR